MEVDSFFGKIKIPDGMLAVKCEMCQMNIGTFDPRKVKIPVDASMFRSLDEFHGAPHPFTWIEGRSDTINWEYLNCPVCGVRVFVDFSTNKHKDYIPTPFGPFRPGEVKIPGPTTIAEKNQEVIDRIYGKEGPPKPVIDAPMAKIREEVKDPKKLPDIEAIPNEQEYDAVMAIRDATPNDDVWKTSIPLKEVFEDEKEFYRNRLETPETQNIPLEDVRTGKGKDLTPHSTEAEFRAKYPGRCIYCGRDCKIPPARGAHEKACPDNPKNQKESDEST